MLSEMDMHFCGLSGKMIPETAKRRNLFLCMLFREHQSLQTFVGCYYKLYYMQHVKDILPTPCFFWTKHQGQAALPGLPDSASCRLLCLSECSDVQVDKMARTRGHTEIYQNDAINLT